MVGFRYSSLVLLWIGHSDFSLGEHDINEPSLSAATHKFQPSDIMELENKTKDRRNMRFETMGDDDVVLNDGDARTLLPTNSPTKSMYPSSVPTVVPTTSMIPSKQPSGQPSIQPSSEPPSAHTRMPTKIPTIKVSPGFPAMGKYVIDNYDMNPMSVYLRVDNTLPIQELDSNFENNILSWTVDTVQSHINSYHQNELPKDASSTMRSVKFVVGAEVSDFYNDKNINQDQPLYISRRIADGPLDIDMMLWCVVEYMRYDDISRDKDRQMESMEKELIFIQENAINNSGDISLLIQERINKSYNSFDVRLKLFSESDDGNTIGIDGKIKEKSNSPSMSAAAATLLSMTLIVIVSLFAAFSYRKYKNRASRRSEIYPQELESHNPSSFHSSHNSLGGKNDGNFPRSSDKLVLSNDVHQPREKMDELKKDDDLAEPSTSNNMFQSILTSCPVTDYADILGGDPTFNNTPKPSASAMLTKTTNPEIAKILAEQPQSQPQQLQRTQELHQQTPGLNNGNGINVGNSDDNTIGSPEFNLEQRPISPTSTTTSIGSRSTEFSQVFSLNSGQSNPTSPSSVSSKYPPLPPRKQQEMRRSKFDNRSTPQILENHEYHDSNRDMILSTVSSDDILADLGDIETNRYGEQNGFCSEI